jgi:hypothetical protein
MSYTERFSEAWAYLGGINPASYNSVQDSGNVYVAEYNRIVIIFHAGVLGQDVDVDIEEGKTSSASDREAFDSRNKDFTKTATTDNNTVTVKEIKAEEFTPDYDYINVEATPAGSSAIFGVQIWGGEARHKPVSTANLDDVED